MRRLLSLATGVTAVLLVSCGSPATVSSGTSTTRAAPAPSTSTTGPGTTPSTVTTVAPACSAAGLSPTISPDAGLPAPVAAMRSDLARAAVSCDWTALATLADRDGKAVRFSFGAETDPVAYWKAEEQRPGAVAPMKALRLLVGLPYAEQTLPDGTRSYVWPTAFASEHPTREQLQQVADSGLYSMATLEGWVQSGNNYLGYRVIISGTGDWTLFVAGD